MKNLYEYSYCTKNSINFVKLFDMKNDQRLMAVTEVEADLIEAARNYVKAIRTVIRNYCGMHKNYSMN